MTDTFIIAGAGLAGAKRAETLREYTGFARTWDRVVFRGDPAAREFIRIPLDTLAPAEQGAS
jgi:hypothetical protein